jgi:mRNA interferase MazF
MKRGDVVLLSYPFTDLSSVKVRPAIVISTDKFNAKSHDTLFICITTKNCRTKYDFRVEMDHPNFKTTGLKAGSTVRISKIMCLQQTLIKRKLGNASPTILKKISAGLKLLLEI